MQNIISFLLDKNRINTKIKLDNDNYYHLQNENYMLYFI